MVSEVPPNLACTQTELHPKDIQNDSLEYIVHQYNYG